MQGRHIPTEVVETQMPLIEHPVVKLLTKRRWIPIGARLEGPKLEPERPRAEVGFSTADQGFSSIQGTLFGFCGI